MSQAYPSNLTHAQYEFLSELIPEAKPGGRKREVDMWEVLNSIFYVLIEGVTMNRRLKLFKILSYRYRNRQRRFGE